MSSKTKTPPRKNARSPSLSEEGNASASPSPDPRPAAKNNHHESERIGDILRRVREHRGEHLEEISDYLRIRPAYLFALEQSHYEELPADAYVIGFLRSYATYLGLDGRGAIDQYRREMAGARRKPQLSMPQPIPEGRAPTLAIIVAGLVAAMLVYFIWFALSSPEPLPTENAPPLSSVEQTPLEAVTVSPQTTTTDVTDLSTQTATTDGITLGVTAASTTVAQEPAALSKQQTPAKEETTTTPPSVLPNDKPAETVPDSTPAPKPETPAPASFGEKSGKSALVITAEKDSWILVTDSKGNTVFDRTMKTGETYNVPTGKGLKLTTGNTSGVGFTLDGQPLPKLKTNGKVARAVPLEPEKLKARLTGAAPQPEPSADETED